MAQSVDDWLRPPEHRSVRQLPALIFGALRLVWKAGRFELIILLGLQLLQSALLAGQVFAIRLLLKALLSHGLAHISLPGLLPATGLLGGLIAMAGLAGAVQSHPRLLLTALVTRHASGRVLDVTSTAPLESFDDPGFHDRLTRALMSQHRPFQLVQGFVQLTQGLTNIAAVAIAVWIVQPLLLPLILVAFLPLVASALGAGKEIYLLTASWTPRERERNYLQGLLMQREPAKEIRAFDLGRFLRARYERLYTDYLSELRKMLRRRAGTALVTSTLTGLFFGGILVFILFLVSAHHLTLPQAGTALVATFMVGFTVPGILMAASQLYECVYFISDYQSFVTPPSPGWLHGGTLPPFSSLVVDHVSFRYPASDRPALQEVSLEIGSGEVIALVGENGSGKTTLAKLLCHLYSPTAGRILWDGVDTGGFDPARLRDSITLIFQDFVQYMLPASENIGLGRHERVTDRAAITAAARRAGAAEFLSGLAEGYDSLLGPIFEGGTELSVGQWQRVALARAFFRDSPFLILDEPTASLDARAENELFQSIRQLAHGRSVLLISHRFSSVRSADRIYVLKEGRIVEAGTHEQLLAQDGLYAELFLMQAEAYQVAR